MIVTVNPLRHVILDLLAKREHRLLVLVVAVRRALGPFEYVKGDLSDNVRDSLNTLIAAGTVTESDGVFALRRRK
jgi:hypothetical protein